MKVERDAKEISIGIKTKKPEHLSLCKLCKDSGALIYCSHCPNSYHLNCARMKESDIPYGNWYCNKCVPILEKKLKDEYAKQEKIERNSKGNKLKEVVSVLSNFEKDKIVMKFAKKFPQFVKQGKINYPIEDRLLELDPEFHQVVLGKLPKPMPCNYPQDVFLEIVSITLFAYTFSSHIGITPFSIDKLYSELEKDNESVLIKEIVMSLIKELIVYILSKENLDEQFSGQNKFLYSAYKLSNVFNIIDYLPYSWLTLFSEVMTSNTFKDYIEDTAAESIISKFEEFPLESNFFKYNLSEKVSCITFLISCFCDTKVFHEALSERIEQRTELSREKAMIKVQIKELEQKQAAEVKAATTTRKSTSLADRIAKFQNKVHDLSHKIEDIQVRVTPIGLDRDYNEYYIFKFELSKIYMLKPLENTWYYFSTKEDIEELMQNLCPKGLRENKLLENLKARFPQMKFGSDSERKSDDDYFNKLSEFKNTNSDLATAKKLMLDLEKKFTKYLNKSNKQWEIEENQFVWREKVTTCDNVFQLSELLLEHYEKSSTPLRVSVNDSFSDSSEEAEYEKKYRKVSIRLWQDFGDHNLIWEQLVQSVANSQQLILAIALYTSVLEHYIQKKNENMKSEEKKRPKEDKRKKEPKTKTNGVKHEDHCFFCEDGGELICCEGCSRVVHPECIGFDKVPDDDWYCDSCNKQGTRVTRSKARLRKLNI
ncbi:hypothetical protein SteCoe_22794 [Stentor coeruleus]|uniref:PHD-type domain-containing protein n=1 Tax=Stentor coeruleus TaxID=5963 RepID=A0A1R2BLF1_9CILI|nr:hypothetical protein SteCoe_22794 [Stentor coeruleus]